MSDIDSMVDEVLGSEGESAQAVAQTAIAGPSINDLLDEVESDPTLPGNDMMNPEGGNALSFATKLKLSLVGDDKLSQEKTLKAEYGEENVMPAPDGEGFVVKELGSWKKADSTIMSDIAATSPEVLMGMAGSAMGSVLGAMTPVPGGAYMGWVAGGSAASALATVVKNYGAKKIGIKTEYDADMALDTFQKELTWNLAFDSVLGGAGKLVKGALNRGMAKGGAKVLAPAIQAFEGGDKEFASQAFESLVSGTKREDWRTVLRSNDDKLAVKEDMDKIYKWERTPEHIRTPVNPASEQLANVTTSALAGAKKMAFDQHEQVLKKIESTGAMDRPNISLARQAAGFRTELANLGLLGKDSKTGKDILKKRASDDDSGIMQVFDAKSLNTLGKVFGQLNSVLETSVDGKSVERTLSFKEAKQMLNGIDDILESSGYYKNGEAAISNNARRSLVGLRRGINESVVKSLEGVQVEGRDASKMFAEANAKYSNFRSLYDDFAVPSALGGSDQKVVQTVERMFSDSNDVQKADFVKMLKQTVGPKARLTVNRIEQLKAARNLSEVYTSANKGIGAAIKSKMGMNPYDMANALADQAVLSGKIAHAKLTPVSAVKQSAVEGWARGLDFANKLTSDKKQLLLGNPVLMREFLMSVTGVPGEMQETSDTMLGGPQ